MKTIAEMVGGFVAQESPFEHAAKAARRRRIGNELAVRAKWGCHREIAVVTSWRIHPW